MARPVIVDTAEGTRIPFLRGILTRSLQAAGLPFETAYELATEVRTEISADAEVSAEQLRARVVKHLKPHGDGVVQRYLAPAAPPEIHVRFEERHEAPYSRGHQRASLVSCGLSVDEATGMAARIYDDLAIRGVRTIDVSALRHLTYRLLLDELGEDAARQYLVWQEFQRSKRPLILLMGGTVGSGKSTVAAQVAHRLGIVRTQSTDMLREVMRMMVPGRMLPVLHTSTFRAWQVLPGSDPSDTPQGSALIDGYLTQCNLIAVASEAVIQRALRERVSLILEGVHAHAGLIPSLDPESDAILVRVTLAVLKPRRLRERISGRGKRKPDRRAKRYLEHFDRIWDLQSYMLHEADEAGVPIVPNEELDETVHQVMGILMAALTEQFSGTPDEVF